MVWDRQSISSTIISISNMESIINNKLIGTTIKVKGKVLNITFPKNRKKTTSTDGYVIFRFKTTEILSGEIPNELKINDDTAVFYVKGTPPPLNANSDLIYILTATLTNNKQYGLSYTIITMNTDAALQTTEDQYKFLKQILAPTYVTALFDAFENPIEVLNNADIEKLTNIKGIGEFVANRIIQQYNATKDCSLAFAKLADYGLTKRMIFKLIASYGSADTLVKKITENPYILIKEVNGIGWAKADSMALKAGIDPNCQDRITAFFKYYLEKQAEDNGNTWITLNDLCHTITESIAPTLNQQTLIQYIKDAIASQLLYWDISNKPYRIGLYSYRSLEEHIAEELNRLQQSRSFNLNFLDKMINECEKECHIEYTEEQKNAMNNIVSNNVTITMGMAGTGKSSIMKPIVKALQKENYTVSLVALSGKAALNLTEITGIQGTTIHRLLGCNEIDENKNTVDLSEDFDISKGFKYNQNHKLPYDVIIIDELSMVGGEIFYDLIRAIKSGSKLIMLGDDRQLESIGLCNLLSDLRSCGKIKCNEFTKIWRQAADSGIITDSALIASGEQILPHNFSGTVVHGKNQDLKIETAVTPKQTALLAVSEFKRLLYTEKIPLSDIIICTAMRTRNDTSAKNLNIWIQKLMHFYTTDDNIVTVDYKDKEEVYSYTYHVGDRILVTKNNYFTMSLTSHKLEPIYNGNLGIIKKISAKEGKIIATFPQGDILIPMEIWDTIQLGYAITTHKAQGSGIPYVIAVCDTTAFKLNCRELLYTQLTRAKKYCYLCGMTYAIQASINTTRVKNKQTWLPEIIKGVVG